MTRQAYYQYYWYAKEKSFEQQLVLDEVKSIRSRHPKMGVKKLYELLTPMFVEHQIKMGRDALYDLLAANNMLIRRRRRKIRTTYSSHWIRKYPNLIRDFIAERSNQLWVSDITYWKISQGHLYISFVTDAYSHKIVGYHLSETLEAISSIKALQMAVSNLKSSQHQLIHHSDRGIQYCSYDYIHLLKENNITISMTENGDPLENPIAERINGIIKQEYLECYQIENINQATELLDKVVQLYNEERPHLSLGYSTPNQVHLNNAKTKEAWNKKSNLVNLFQE